MEIWKLLKILRIDQMKLNKMNLNNLKAESKLAKKAPTTILIHFGPTVMEEVSGSLVTFKIAICFNVSPRQSEQPHRQGHTEESSMLFMQCLLREVCGEPVVPL